MDESLRTLCRSVGIPELSGGRVAIEAAVKRIEAMAAAIAPLAARADEMDKVYEPDTCADDEMLCVLTYGEARALREALRK